MTDIRVKKFNDLLETDNPAYDGFDYGPVAQIDIPTPETGTKTQFLDSLDNQMKIMDDSRVVTELGGGGSGGLGLAFIDHTNVPAELIRNTEYVCDFSNSVLPDKDLVLGDTSYDGTYSVVEGVCGTFNDGSGLYTEDSNYKIFANDQGGGLWHVIIFDTSTPIWVTCTSSQDPSTFVDGENLGGILVVTGGLTSSEVQDGKNVPSTNESFPSISYTGGDGVSNLVLPEGTGSETFRIAITITKISSVRSVNLNTTNSQVIALPTLPDTETITGINQATAFAVEFDQTNYNWKDTHFPTFANLTGNIPFEEITVGTIYGGEATVDQSGTVKRDKSQTKELQGGGISITTALVPSMTFNGLTIGQLYRVDLAGYFELPVSGGIDSVDVSMYQDTTKVATCFLYASGALGAALLCFDSAYGYFTATNTVLHCGVIIGGTATLRDTSNYTKATLTEIHNTDITTDFT